MADYAIGDVQGCFEPLQRLLEAINFNDCHDRLWFVGDLVNRGPESLAVLRFVKNLPVPPRVTLGNHDLHLLNVLFGSRTKLNQEDTIQDILSAEDSEELGDWLRRQSILYYDAELNVAMCHAGIAPMWHLEQALSYASELQDMLSGDHYRDFLLHMYGNQPAFLSDHLPLLDRLRVICNFFTRMRFCDEQGHLSLTYKGTITEAPKDLYPWYAVPNRIELEADIVFGHWAALNGECPHPRIFALDTGCVWKRHLTALRLQDKRRFVVSGAK